jgi:uncharacterized membrane protein
MNRKKEKPSKENLDKWHKDPNNWKLGLFYIQRRQTNIPSQRMAWAGWTVNLQILFQ